MPLGVRIRSRVTRRARLLGVVLLAGVAASAVLLRPPDPGPVTEVWTAARPLPAGHTISAEDLASTAVRVAGGELPTSTGSQKETLLGSRLAVPVDAGHQVTSSMTVSPRLLEMLPQGKVAVGLRVRDPEALKLIGQSAPVRIYVGGVDGERAEADGSLIWVPEKADGHGFLPADTGTGGQLAFFAVESASAQKLSHMNGEAFVVARGAEDSAS